MRTLPHRLRVVTVALAFALLIAVFSAPISAGGDEGILGDPPPTPPGSFANPPPIGREPAPTWSWEPSIASGTATILRYHVMVSRDSGATWEIASPATVADVHWSPSPAFSEDGIYQIKVQAEDSDHVLSEWGYSSTYVLDRVPPQVALIVPETGLETNNVDLVMRGTASDSPWGVAAVHWEVVDPNGNLVAGSPQFAEPDASFTPSAPLCIEGVYTVRLYAEDRAGNAATAERTFKLDTTDPEMSLYELLATRSRMLHGDVYISDTEDSRPWIKVVAIDTLGGSGFNVDGQLDIEVFSDGETAEPVAGTVTRTPPRPGDDGGSWTALWSRSSPMAPGRYYPRITIADDAGNRLERGGAAYRFVIDTIAPGMPDDPSCVGQINTGNEKRFTNSRRPLIGWSAAFDPDLPNGVRGAGIAGYQLEVWTKQEGESSPSGVKIYTAPGTVDPWADQMPIAPTGGLIEQHTPGADLSFQNGASYGAWIRARDRVDNASEWVDPPFVFDSSPPSMPGDPSLAGAMGGRAATGRPAIEWAHATDAEPGVCQSGADGYEVKIRHAGASSWDVLNTFVDLDPDEDVDGEGVDSPLSGDFDWTVSQLLADGSYELVVRALDVAGNASEWSAVLQFEVDAMPPETPIIAPLAPGYNTSPILIDWSDVADGDNAITYVLQRSANAQFASSIEVAGLTDSRYSFDAEAAGEGGYWFRVKTVSTLPGAGGVKESGWSESVHTVYDKTGPKAPVLTRLTPSPTNQTSQAWSWNPVDADDAAGYKVSVDGGASWTDVHNTFAYQTAFDATGIHTFGVKAYDWLRNDGAPAMGSIEIDVTPPDAPGGVFLVSPSVVMGGKPHTADGTPDIRWLSSGSAVQYQVEVDGQAWIRATDVEYEFTKILADGEHTVRVSAADALGNWSGYSDPLVFVIDTAPPPPPGRPSAASPTSNRNPVWTWVPVEGAARYRVFEDGADKGLVTAPPFTSANLPEGSHYLQVTALDELGNESERSASGTVEIDLTPPDPPQMQALPAFTNPGAHDGLLVFEWVAEADAIRFDLKYSAGGLDPVTVVLNVTRYELDISGLDDGVVIQSRAMAYDAAGNGSGWSELVRTKLDKTGPSTTAVTTPVTPTADPRPTWAWTSNDGTGSGLSHYVAALDSAGPFETSAETFTPASDLPNGVHVLRVKAVDNVGNIGEELVFDDVVVDAALPAAPAVQGLAPGYNTSPILIDWSDVADGDNAIAYVLQRSANAQFASPIEVAGLTDSRYSFDAETAGEGEYWFRVKTVSTLPGAGGVKESGWSAAVSTIYDKTGPAAPVLTLATPSPTNQALQVWTWNPVDADDAAGYKVSADGASWIDVHNTFAYQTAFDATGTYAFAVKAYDWLRNEGAQATGSIEIDVTPPDIPIRLVLVSESVIIDGIPHTADTTPTIKWDSSEDAVNHRVEIDGQAWIYTADSVYEFTEGLEKGRHTVRAAAADDLGNWSGYSDPLVFVIDTTPPPPPGRPSATSPTNNRNPVWTWAAVEGAARYRLFEDGVDKGLVTEPMFTSANLPEGFHYLQVTALDELGNESEKSASGTVEVDLTPPDPPRMQGLPAFISPTANGGRLVFQWVAGADAVRFDLQYSIGGLDPVTAALSVTRYEIDISGLGNGVGVQGQVRAYDDAGNGSNWSEWASTTIDSVGPAVRIVQPTMVVYTNTLCPVWKWEVVDDDTAPIEDYRVTLVAGEHALPEIWTSSSEFMPVPDLGPGTYVLRVAARDELGNIGPESAFPAVHVVVPEIHAPIPTEDVYPVNKVSTIAFSVSGMWDARLKVLANGRPVPDRSVIVVSRPSGFIRFYVLIDADMADPGERLTIKVEAGSASREFVYEILKERSGFGFGRLRPWDW